MNLIQQITTDSNQTRTLILADGTQLTFTMYCRPMQYGWFITNLVYQSFTLTELRITNSPNMLHQFRNQIPFGLACYTAADREPSQQQDFSSGASTLYLLTAADVAAYTKFLTGS